MLRKKSLPSDLEYHILLMFRLFLIKTRTRNAQLEKLLAAGCCFGLAVTRAVMRMSGKSPWWNEVITHVVHWDGRLDSLEKKHLLPGAKNLISLKEIFERAIHYVAFNQASSELYPETGINQINFLLPGGFFEMLDEQGRLLKIKENFRIGGYFAQDDLVNIFNNAGTKLIQNNICLIHEYYPRVHTYEVGFEKGSWTFYLGLRDVKRYSDVRLLAAEIKKIIHKSIIIELACVQDVNENPFAYYDVLLEHHAARLLQTDTLIHLADLCPESLNDVLENLDVDEYSSINCNQVNPSGYCPLHFAVDHSDLNITEILCKAGADVNLFASNGKTPLMIAARVNNASAIEALNNYGADPNLISHNGLQTALMIAASVSNENVIKALLKNKNINLDLHTPANVSPCVEARLKPAFENYCRKYPENIPFFTALHYAVFFENEPAVKLLLNAMENISIETLNELYDLAYILEKKNIIPLIQNHLALKLNLKRKAEDVVNERPTKKPKNSYPLFFDKKEEIDHIEGASVLASLSNFCPE